MRQTFFLIGFLVLSFSVQASEKVVESKYFDKQKIYTDKLYVLNDILVFSIFDISEVEIQDESGSAEIKLTSVESEGKPVAQVASLSGKKEIERVLPEIPKFYYKSLRQKILEYDVPMTLYSKNPPAYARPIKLSIKLKKIHLLPVKVNEDGNYVQPVEMKIYGQLKDEKKDEILTRFYDSAHSEFLLGLGPDSLSKSLNDVSTEMMKDLSLFLRTKF